MKTINLFVANASGSLSEQFKIIQSAFDRASSVAQSLIGLTDVDVICIDDSNMVIPEVGVGGYTPGRHLSYLYVDPLNKELSEQEIFNTLCHELYHAKSYDGQGYGSTLLDSMIFEGLATAFEDEVSHGNSFVVKELNARNTSEQLLQKHRDELLGEDFNHFRWFIFDETKELPRWAGYEIGYHIVKKYLKKTNKKASELVIEDLSLIESFVDDTSGRSINNYDS